MCECGCVNIVPEFKIIDKDGNAILIGIHASCDYCESPAGIQLVKIEPEDFEMYDVDRTKEIAWDDYYNLRYLAVVDPKHIRDKMKEMITGITAKDLEDSDGVLDEIYADVLADEAFKDIRDEVWKTKDEYKWVD